MHVDTLTGLPDRAALKTALSQAISAGEGTALAVLDVDHFLEINDRYGQEAGDRVLQGLAALISEGAAGQAYRVSGDEFAIVLPGMSLEQAFLSLERLRGRIQESQDRFGLPGNERLTVTAGVAQYPRDAKDEPSLMRTADAALTAAKESGRNQVALPPNEEMVMKSCYYTLSGVRKLKALAERLNRKESTLLREALDDLLRKYDQP
jgi:diguanylate cyclase (GGDEF)-like protein